MSRNRVPEEKTVLESRFAEKNDLLVAHPQTQMIHVLPQQATSSPSQATAISVNFQHVENSLPNSDGFEWRNNNQEISRKNTNQILMTYVKTGNHRILNHKFPDPWVIR